MNMIKNFNTFSGLSAVSKLLIRRQFINTAPAPSPITLTKCLDTNDNQVRTIWLSNDKKRNALSMLTLKEINQHITSVIPENRLLIIRSSNPKVFSSGHDLKELLNSDSHQRINIFQECETLMNNIRHSRIPIMAVVEGLATAAGCQLVATCDMAVATPDSKFATPGVKVGLFCTTPAVPLSRSVGRKLALDMLFTGEAINSEMALNSGLISRVVQIEKMDQVVSDIANDICEVDFDVIALGKKIFYEQAKTNERSALSLASRIMVSNLEMNAAKRGIERFFTKKITTS